GRADSGEARRPEDPHRRPPARPLALALCPLPVLRLGNRYRHEIGEARIGRRSLLGRKAGVERLRRLRDVLERGEAVTRRVDLAIDLLRQAARSGLAAALARHIAGER